MTKKDTPFWKVQPSTRVDFTSDLSKADDKSPFRYLEEDGDRHLVEKDISSKRKIPEITTSTKSGMRPEVSSNAGDLFIKTLAMSSQDRECFLKMVLNNSLLREQIDRMIETEKSAIVVEEIRLEDEGYSDRDVVVSEEPREIEEEKPKSFGEWGA